MQEEKSFDLKTSPDSKYHSVYWFWQCDSDPWKEKDSTKWNWELYSDETLCCIEDAFSSNKTIVDLGSYEIDLKKMLQINKNDKNKLRRIKREVKDQSISKFMIDLPMPSGIEKEQKTINHAFGNVQHFLSYLTKRTPDTYRIIHRLKELHLDSEEKDYKDIVEEVIGCITKGAETRAKVVKTRTLFPSKNYIAEAKKIIDTIKSKSRSLREFLKLMLQIYTMESFVCYWLNKLLRSENWEDMNILAPYLVCLTYTFQVQDYIIKYEESRGWKDVIKSFVSKKTLILYRGTALTQEHFAYYDPKKMKYFSWNGVSSTSRSPHIAKKFIEYSLQKAKQENQPKVGVFFKIETDFASLEDCEGMIDISEDSKYPEEKEMILAPGTVFSLISVRKKGNNIWEVNLELKKKFEKHHKDLSLLGALQNKVILNDTAIFDGLSTDDLIKALQLLEYNQLIVKLEIKNMSINEHLMELVERMRRTTNITQENVLIHKNEISVSSLSALISYYSGERLDRICKDNAISFEEDESQGNKSKKVYGKLRKLTLGREFLDMLYKTIQLKQLYKTLENETNLTHIDLVIQDSYNIGDLMDSMKFLPCLTYLCLDFRQNPTIRRVFRGAFKYLVSLKHLSFNFEGCKQIRDFELTELGDHLKLPTSLKELSLNFKDCDKITDYGLYNLRTVIQRMRCLQHLSLNFEGCVNISDQGMDHIKNALTLPLELTPEVLLVTNDLPFFNFIRHRHQFPNLIPWIIETLLNVIIWFIWIFGIMTDTTQTKEELKNTSKSSWKHLSLNFKDCTRLSDEGLVALESILKVRPFLHHLSLNFMNCPHISYHGLFGLDIEKLTLLHHLSINFAGCRQVSDNALRSIINDLRSMKSLQRLSVCFAHCSRISDHSLEGLENVLQVFGQLQDVSLEFSGCNAVTEKVLKSLKGAFLVLSTLQNVALDFTNCDKISNEHLKELKTELHSKVVNVPLNQKESMSSWIASSAGS